VVPIEVRFEYRRSDGMTIAGRVEGSAADLRSLRYALEVECGFSCLLWEVVRAPADGTVPSLEPKGVDMCPRRPTA